MDKTEAKIQSECVDWFRQVHNDKVLFAVPNEGNRINGAIMVAMGLTSGVADMIFMQPKTGQLIGIETKTPTGVQSPKQKVWEKKCIANGGQYYIIRSLSEFQNLIEKLLSTL